MRIISSSLTHCYLQSDHSGTQRYKFSTREKPPTSTIIATTPTPQPPTPTNPATTLPERFLAAQEGVAKQYDLAIEQVVLISYLSVEWPNSCLWENRPGNACMDVITPGYELIFETPMEMWKYTRTQMAPYSASLPRPAALKGECWWVQPVQDQFARRRIAQINHTRDF